MKKRFVLLIVLAALSTGAFAEINFSYVTGLVLDQPKFESQGFSLDYEWHFKYFNVSLGFDWKENEFIENHWANDMPGVIFGIGKDFNVGELISTDIRFLFTSGGPLMMLDYYPAWRFSLMSKWSVTAWKVSPTLSFGVEYTRKQNVSKGGFSIPLTAGIAVRI